MFSQHLSSLWAVSAKITNILTGLWRQWLQHWVSCWEAHAWCQDLPDLWGNSPDPAPHHCPGAPGPLQDGSCLSVNSDEGCRLLAMWIIVNHSHSTILTHIFRSLQTIKGAIPVLIYILRSLQTTKGRCFSLGKWTIYCFITPSIHYLIIIKNFI